ncbi:hypothetical protein [Dermacoccus nishinomiyaensis]|uniref:hypothetical protein n=1 Tax=Dermacoccus nishinomiyaensis TaxID=1274 RepID=UPI003F4A70CC
MSSTRSRSGHGTRRTPSRSMRRSSTAATVSMLTRSRISSVHAKVRSRSRASWVARRIGSSTRGTGAKSSSLFTVTFHTARTQRGHDVRERVIASGCAVSMVRHASSWLMPARSIAAVHISSYVLREVSVVGEWAFDHAGLRPVAR